MTETACRAAFAHEPQAQRGRQRLLARLEASGISNQQVLEVVAEIPRHWFIDEALGTRAYEDSALPIGHGQTISQPYIVARMTELLLESGPCSTVLEIGTGSGFQAAVLAMLVRRVYTIERLAALWGLAEPRLRALKLRNVRYRHGDGRLGWPEMAPFDGIIMTAASEGIPRGLAEQLTLGGCMVLPLVVGAGQRLVRLTRTRSGFRHEDLEPAMFVPLLGGLG
ncbi:protein-L-isoaspartate(D-aspartate) O-methyltransferase [Rhabdochromatium marinum]|uniref:protein-L-isoaspartate(D-aspartate) O-methyltransferase n=1 Tax=Rhabdochromatium marinum TaxID=48729 RepID=UPI001908CB5A|nr:protein-L-isoaspartate(D-aspartate) O-methyltransferase [Rhabdochromatium marinum]MBK1649114.1 protein-L-isoaspartate O-methyltransferase [Rhabdochromatium marinum]